MNSFVFLYMDVRQKNDILITLATTKITSSVQIFLLAKELSFLWTKFRTSKASKSTIFRLVSD